MALSPEMLKEHFEQAKKCQISGTIEKIEILNESECLSDSKIFIKGENNTISIVYGTQRKDNCIIDSYNKVFGEKDLQIGAFANYIVDENYRPLEFDQTSVDVGNINFCTGNITPSLEKHTTLQEGQNYIPYGIIILALILIGVLLFKKSKNTK